MKEHSDQHWQSRIRELEEKLEQSAEQLTLLSAKLLQAESQRSNFLSHILNEINNPLTSILGLTNNIRHMAYSNPEQVHRQANLAYEQAFELDYKMRNVFAAAAIEAGVVTVQRRKLEVSDILDQVIQDLYFKYNQKNINIQVTRKIAEGQLFSTDPVLFQAILLNLVGNAIEFSPEGEEIKIDLHVDKPGIVFTISDHGAGISPKDQTTIFSRFKQLDEGVTKAHQGTGLGLSIVQEYTELLSGSLDLISELGMGSTFVINLPTVEFPEAFEEVSLGDEEIF
ncbi:MAG: HAMP domain-containing sensor histidine kinase [Bacteroidota bacterium]